MPGALSRVTFGDLTAENRFCSRERALPTLAPFVVSCLRCASRAGAFPMGVAPCSSVTGFVRAPLSRRAERALGSLEGFSLFSGTHFHSCRSAASPRSRERIAWERCAGDPGPYDRRLQPTRFIFNDVCSSRGSLRIARYPRDSGARDSRPRSLRGSGSTMRAAFPPLACGSASLWRPSEALAAAGVRDEHAPAVARAAEQ